MPESVLEWALFYLQRGWSVIPAGGNKRPLIKWREFTQRRPTEAEVRRWYARSPKAGVAVVTGAVSGIVVLDVDIKNDGDQSLEALIGEGQIPKAALEGSRVRTPSGGAHYYFAYPGGKTVQTLLGFRPGLDLKGDRGYVIAPPTKGQKGGWTWEVGP